MQRLSTVFVVFILLMQTVQYADAETPTNNQSFFEKHCLDCHGQTDPSGGLDLTTVGDQLNDPKAFDLWVKIHDRVRDGEMPPPKDHVIDDAVRNPWLTQVGQWLTEFDDARWSREGRATRRRLNRYEYENALRDLLDAPWLQVKNMLPEDGEAYRFNKSGDALDVSHVQIARYLAASESALRAVMADQIKPPEAKTTRYYARNSRAFSRKVQYSVFNKSPERATFPIIGFEADVDVLDDKAPMTVGDKDPERRELEAMGVVASSYEPLEIKFDEFKAPRSGRYKLRFNAFSFWAKPESEEKWWRPSRHQLEQGRTREPVTVYSETPPRLLRKIGNFEVNPEPNVYEIEVDLLEGETVRPDAVRLFRSRPPGPWQNPLAERDGQPGVAFRWLEVEGPIIKQWPPAGHQRMFADLPLVVAQGQKQPSVKPRDVDHDARRLLQRFMVSAYREEVLAEDVDAFLKIISKAQESGSSFQDAMIAGYSAVLCSPAFVTIEERPGPLSDEAIATRLAFFLWNSPPDAVLRKLASQKQLRKPDVLREQTLRMLADRGPRVS